MSRNTSMLVVSNRVYAKREEDGALHPGLVESKQEDCYTVKFSDETRSAVLEKDLVWIAFWGLPSSCWPEYPVIQTTVLGTVELDDKIRSMANKVADRESKETALFTVNEISESDESLSDSSSSSGEDSQSVNKFNGAKQNPIQMCASSEPTRSQTRPSVLRLNTGLLHKDSPHSHLLASSLRKEATETVKILPRLSPSIQENLENNDSKLKSKFLIESEDRSCIKNTSSFAAERTSPNSKILLTTKFANNSESLWSLTGREMENQTNTRRISLNPDAAWYSRDWSETFPLNRSNLTPSIIPLISAKYFSQEPLLFRELYETLSRKGPLITDNTQLFNEEQKKRKRSDDTKKCRKVYGVDNRHAWCTQCKWKKACARFGD